MSQPTVPTYKLFGEKQLWQTPEPLHHETIAARSALYDWEITPHSHDNLLHVVFLQNGAAEISFETRRVPLQTPCLLMVPPQRVHGFRFSPDIVGQIVTLPQPLVDELLALSPELRQALGLLHYLPLAEEPAAFDLMRLHFEEFAREYSGREAGRVSVLKAIIGLALVRLLRSGGLSAAETGGDRIRQRVARFSELIERHFRDWQPLAFYANRLGVSTAQLNNSCRREAGLSAQHMIHGRLLLEARRLLAYSDLDVTGIGYALGFRDPAYFSRFFTRMQGMSPSAFRQAQGRGA